MLHPSNDTKAYYSFRAANEPEWFVNKILAHRWVDSMGLELQVHWTLGNVIWEPLASCKELAALDEYIELCRVKQPCDLPHKTQLSREDHAPHDHYTQRNVNSAVQLQNFRSSN